MKYYELAIKGLFLDELIYESKEDIEPLSEVLLDLQNKKDLRAIVLKECQKPNFKTRAIKKKTGAVLSKTQFDLASFISYYHNCKLSFVLSSFECLQEYKCKKIEIQTQMPNLSDIQKDALSFIKQEKISLLFADTGSGKTEIYISLLKEYLEQGKQALLLMPEISLTPQMQKRLEFYFKDSFFLWHSKISKKKKQENLQRLKESKSLLVAGARSALFLPFQNLGLIIVDEEHDNSYKANNIPRFNARDLAIFLGQKADIKVLLGSATPSLNTFYKQKSFRIKGSFFKAEKEFIYDEDGLGLSSMVLRELKITLQNKKQAIVFLPIKANFRQILCKCCGKSIQCPFCSISLSMHKKKNILKCHYCGFVKSIDKNCPSCNASMLEARKMGTAELCDLLEKELKDFNARIMRFDSDEISSFSKLNSVLKSFNKKEIDILVGTSMLAKGHDYHEVDLSVILGLDEYLFRPDYKALEESLALAMQVAGRAGRKNKARVLLQSKNKNFFQKYINDYDAFLRDELEIRKNLYPPFTRLLRILIEDKNEKKASLLCANLASQYKRIQSIELVGYGACAISLLNQNFRFYILLRSTFHDKLIKAAKYALTFKNVSVDMDPIDFS